MKSKKMLPYVMDKTLKCYPNNTFYEEIISIYRNMEGWFIEHYIQLSYRYIIDKYNSDIYETQINFYDGWNEARKLFKVQSYNLYEINYNKIIGIIKKNINEDNYCYIYLNKINTSNNVNTLKDSVIIGWNDYKKYFYVVQNDNDLFKLIKFPYTDFLKAFKSGQEISEKFGKNSGSYYLNFIKPIFNIETNYTVNLKNIYLKSKEYEKSINTSMLINKKDLLHFKFKTQLSIIGSNIYECWLEEVRSCLKVKSFLDYKKFIIIYEHKLMMKKRINYLTIKYNLDLDFLYVKVEKMIIIANMLKFCARKYNEYKNNKMLLEVLDKISELYKRDTSFMNEFVLLLNKILIQK